MKKFCILINFILLISCSKDNPGDVVLSSDVLNITGTRFSASNNNFENTYTKFKDTLQKQDSLQIIAEVDHASNARAVGRVLNPNKIIFFSEGSLDTKLLQKNQLSALDLPSKVLFFQNNNGVAFVMYNSTTYLESRYGLEGVNELTILANTMRQLVKSATSATIKRSVDLSVDLGEGIITKNSPKNFQQTYLALKSAISTYENFNIIAIIDHKANAFSLGKELRPTITFIISDPSLGTALIQDSQTAGLDLPEKIILWQDVDSVVNISYNDPKFLQFRHNIPNSSPEVAKFSAVLDSITTMAISK